jgi:hypothetical protein
LRAWAADTLKRVPGWITEARTLEKWLAVPLPLGAAADPKVRAAAPGESRLDPSPHALRQMLRLANLCMADSAPERQWVHGDQALQDAQALIARNRPVFASFHERRQRLLQTYHEHFFELELDRIARGFAGPYLSWFRIFNGSFRRDRRAIKRRSRNDLMPDTVAEDVALGRDLVAEKARLEGEGPKRQTILGRYENGMNTDWDAADRATRVAAEAIQLVHQLGCSTLPARLVDALCATTPPAEKIRAAFKRLNDSVGFWQHATQDVKALLPVESLPHTGEELDECALSVLMNFARDLQAALNGLGGLTDPVLARAPAAPGRRSSSCRGAARLGSEPGNRSAALAVAFWSGLSGNRHQLGCASQVVDLDAPPACLLRRCQLRRCASVSSSHGIGHSSRGVCRPGHWLGSSAHGSRSQTSAGTIRADLAWL